MLKALSQSLAAGCLLTLASLSQATAAQPIIWKIFDPAIPAVDSSISVTCPDNTVTQLTAKNAAKGASCSITPGTSSTIKLKLAGATATTCEAVIDSSGKFDAISSSCKPVTGPLPSHVLTFSAATGISPDPKPLTHPEQLVLSFAKASTAGFSASCHSGCSNITQHNQSLITFTKPLSLNGAMTLNFSTSTPSKSCQVVMYNQFINDRETTCQGISISTVGEGYTTNTLSFPTTKKGASIKTYPSAIAGHTGSKLASRTLTFENQCDQPVWFNLIAGTASITPSGTETTAKNTTKSNAQCVKNGTSLGTCPSGTSCRYTSATDAYCYFDAPSVSEASNPLDTYKLDAPSTAGGNTTQTVSLPIYDNNDIIFSGGASARIGCMDDKGNYLPECAIGNCNNSRNALGCGYTNGTENGSTIAEFTFQKNTMDFYDLSIINGAHIPMSMTPTVAQNQVQQSQPSSVVGYYWCGTPGGTAAASTSNQQQPACDWQFTENLPMNPAKTSLAKAAHYYINVAAPENSSTLSDVTYCNSDYSCNDSSQSCGLSLELISNLGKTDLKTLFSRGDGPFICGKKLGMTTPVNACSLLGDVDDAYLNCNNTVNPVIPGSISKTNKKGKTTSLSFTNLYSCNGNTDNCIKAKSAYSAEGKVCCGCTTWQDVNTSIQSGQTTACSFNGSGSNTNGYWDGSESSGADVKGKIKFLKQGCPTAYAYQFDDATSTFNCEVKTKPKKRGDKTPNLNTANYTITFCPAGKMVQ